MRPWAPVLSLFLTFFVFFLILQGKTSAKTWTSLSESSGFPGTVSKQCIPGMLTKHCVHMCDEILASLLPASIMVIRSRCNYMNFALLPTDFILFLQCRCVWQSLRQDNWQGSTWIRWSVCRLGTRRSTPVWRSQLTAHTTMRWELGF